MRPSGFQLIAGSFACKFALDGDKAPMFVLLALMIVMFFVDLIFYAKD